MNPDLNRRAFIVGSASLAAVALSGCAGNFNNKVNKPGFNNEVDQIPEYIDIPKFGRVYNARKRLTGPEGKRVAVLRPGEKYLASTLDYSTLPNELPKTGEMRVVIKRSKQVFALYDGDGKRVMKGPCGTGKPGQYDTELGRYEIVNLLGGKHKSSAYGIKPGKISEDNPAAPMPYAMRIKALDGQNKDDRSVDGKALHGSGNVLSLEGHGMKDEYALTVGNSHGCLNLPTDMAKIMHDLMSVDGLGGKGVKKNLITVEE